MVTVVMSVSERMHLIWQMLRHKFRVSFWTLPLTAPGRFVVVIVLALVVLSVYGYISVKEYLP